MKRLPCTLPDQRSGATLVEVLMALLVMAIGVTSVFTLFPLSILKAVKANQQTNAKLYEGAIRDTLLGTPQLWTGAPLWQESSLYYWPANLPHDPASAPYPSRWATPLTNGNFLPNTNILFRCQLDSTVMGPPSPPYYSGNKSPAFPNGLLWTPNDFDSTNNPNTGGYQNNWPYPATNVNNIYPFPASVFEGVIEWIPYRHSQYLADGTTSAYVVDPLGWYRQVGTADQDQFGRILTGDTTDETMYMDRIHCQLSSAASSQVFQLRDSWNVTLDATPVTVTIPAAGRVQVQFPDTIDLSGQTNRNQIVLLSTLSARTVELPMFPSSTSTVTYPVIPGASTVELDGVLPAGFVPDQARIEVQTLSRYSWLMAIHADARGRYEAQCAVVLNRSYEVLDEQGYRAEFCQTEDLNDDGTLAPTEDVFWDNDKIDVNMAKVRWPYNADFDGPGFREGGYIFDAAYGFWYQIQKIEPIDGEQTEQRVDASDAPDPNGGYVRTILRLSDAVEVSTGHVSHANPFTDYLANGVHDGRAVIIPGVIHVFHVTP